MSSWKEGVVRAWQRKVLGEVAGAHGKLFWNDGELCTAKETLRFTTPDENTEASGPVYVVAVAALSTSATPTRDCSPVMDAMPPLFSQAGAVFLPVCCESLRLCFVDVSSPRTDPLPPFPVPCCFSGDDLLRLLLGYRRPLRSARLT